VHIAHHSAADSLFLLREAKRRGVDVTAETCPQYLLLNGDHMLKLGGVMRLNPPMREARHNQPLWDALMDGTLDMIATDHAPHAPDEKTRESIWDCDCGFPGVETQMPLMLTEVNAAPLMDYVRWSAVNPAKAWGLYGTKGVIAPGALPTSSSTWSARARCRRTSCRASARSRRGTAAGAGLPAAHAAARALRDARGQAGDRCGRLGPFGEGRAEDAAPAKPRRHRGRDGQDRRQWLRQRLHARVREYASTAGWPRCSARTWAAGRRGREARGLRHVRRHRGRAVAARHGVRAAAPPKPRRPAEAPDAGHRASRATSCPRNGPPRAGRGNREGRARAMDDAGIDDRRDVHFVQVKCPLLTSGQGRRRARARRRDRSPADTYESMGYSRGASALGVALALGEIQPAQVSDAAVLRDWSLPPRWPPPRPASSWTTTWSSCWDERTRTGGLASRTT
jgi:hypothetical protein